MLRLCGEAEDKLAQELIHFELQVERDVIEPLFVLAEVSSSGPGVTVPGTHIQNKPGGEQGFTASVAYLVAEALRETLGL